MKLNVLEITVKKFLTERPITRGDDFILYGFVLQDMGIDLNMSVRHLLGSHIKLGIPPFESVTRCRRKLQKKNPELVIKRQKEIRAKEQEKYIDYNKE